MDACGNEAVLLITGEVAGTATSVARKRTTLTCGLPSGHDGPHRDATEKESWESRGAGRQMLFRHEDGA